MRRPRPGRAGVAALALLACAACRVPPPDLSADPGELLAALRARQGRLRRVSGSAWIRLDGPGARGAARALVAAEKPDRLRVEVLDFFGTPVLSLAASGGRFVLHDARSDRWIRGTAAGPGLGSLLPGAPPLPDLVAALCGSALLLDGAAVGAAPGEGLRELRLVADGLEQRVRVGPGTAALGARTVRLRDGAGPEAVGPDLEFGRFRTLGGGPFPLEVAWAGAGAHLSFRWGEDLVLNGDGAAAAHALAPPAGAAVEEWDGIGAPPPALPLGAGE